MHKRLIEKHTALRKFIVMCRFLLIIVISLNVGKLLGYGIFKLIIWLGILPYLEKFFGWFIFW